MSRPRVQLVIAGKRGGTNVGASLLRAASALDVEAVLLDTAEAERGPRLLRALLWRLDRRPPRLRAVSRRIVRACREAGAGLLITTGAAPLTRASLHDLQLAGTVCINVSTDDPWNPPTGWRWLRKALPTYDVVFTPRRANIEDFRSLGCAEVHYLPFGFDPELFSRAEPPQGAPSYDVLFVGGADPDRVRFMSGFTPHGPPVALVGGGWDRWPATRPYALGHKPPEAVRALTAAAKVNLCLLRRANRDGHVMRSLEIPAIGGCMLVEDTDEHRAIFGPDDACVVYFREPRDAAEKAWELVEAPETRARLAEAVHARIIAGGHTYADRLNTILSIVAERSARSGAGGERA